MNNSILHEIVQAIALLSAAGGLVYAALQFRGWRASQFVANFTKLVELQLEICKMAVDDPTLGSEGTPSKEVRATITALCS